MNLEKNFSENNFAICFQFSLGIRGELTTFEKELSALKKYETNYRGFHSGEKCGINKTIFLMQQRNLNL